MYQHEFKKRVRYGETDQMGYLYYGNYAQYYEIGRVEMLRSLGLSYKEMEQKGVMMPVVTLNVRYVRPALYDELITIRTTLREIPDRFIVFHMELFNENNKLINGGTVKLCFVDTTTYKSVSVPNYLLEKLATYFEED